MSLRESMIVAARRSGALLGGNASRVAGFVESQRDASGGFLNRGGDPDLYYTVFGLDCLAALGVELPEGSLAAYLESFGSGDTLDLVHVACLARCLARAGRASGNLRAALLSRLAAWRTPDGGFSQEAGAKHGTAYGCFVAIGAYEDLGAAIPDPGRMAAVIRSCRTRDGGYANEPAAWTPVTPTTAAAVCVQKESNEPVDETVVEWLRQRHSRGGGFCASPLIPLPDLLSTATALHALSRCGVPLEGIRGPCLDFVMGLLGADGGFRGHPLDSGADVEYTFYGLLALGHLAP